MKLCLTTIYFACFVALLIPQAANSQTAIQHLDTLPSMPIFTREVLLPGAPSKAQWQKTEGPSTSMVSCLATDGGRLFAGVLETGVYCTTDSGDTWIQRNQGLSNLEIQSLAVEGQLVFAGSINGLFRSTDDGRSWQITNLGIPKGYPVSVPAVVVHGNVVLAVVNGVGLFRSSDSGIIWLSADSGLQGDRPQSLGVAGENLLAGGIYKVHGSTNYGINWDHYAFLGEINSFSSTGSNVFAGTIDGRVAMSTDEGFNWSTIPFPYRTALDHVLAIGSTLFLAGLDSMYYSNSIYIKWKPINDGLVNYGLGGHELYSLATDGKWLYAGTNGGGVYRLRLSDVPGFMRGAIH